MYCVPCTPVANCGKGDPGPCGMLPDEAVDVYSEAGGEGSSTKTAVQVYCEAGMHVRKDVLDRNSVPSGDAADAEYRTCGVAKLVADAGKLCEERFGDETQQNIKVQNCVSMNNVCVLDPGTPDGTEYGPQDEHVDDVGGGGDDGLDDRTLGEEGPRGSDRLGLEKGRARVKRLSDDEFSSSKCTWGKGAGTQEMGVIQSGIQAETQLFGETGNSAVARTGSGDDLES